MFLIFVTVIIAVFLFGIILGAFLTLNDNDYYRFGWEDGYQEALYDIRKRENINN